MNKKSIFYLLLTVALAFAFAFPILGFGATIKTECPTNHYNYKMKDNLAQQEGKTPEQIKAECEARLAEIAKEKGITVKELKQQIYEKKMVRLEEIAKKKGISVEELKKNIAEKKGISVEELQKKMSEGGFGRGFKR